MQQVISEQEERYKRLEETLLKIVADNEQQRVEEAKRAEEFEALKQQLEEIQAKVGTLADEVTAAKATEERTPAPTTTTPTSQPVDNNSEVTEKEEKEVKEEVKEKILLRSYTRKPWAMAGAT